MSDVKLPVARTLSWQELRDAKLSRELVCDNIDAVLREFGGAVQQA